MVDSFFSTAYGRLSLSGGYPPEFSGPFLAGGRAAHFTSEFGDIVLQEIKSERFRIAFFSFRFQKKATLACTLDRGLYTVYAFKGEGFITHARKRFRLRERQFVLAKHEGCEWRIELAAGKPSQLLLTSYGDEVALDVLPAFPSLKDVLPTEHQTFVAGPYSVDAEIRDAVYKLLYAAYEPYKLPYYFNAKVSECLFLFLNKTSGDAELEDKLVPTEWEVTTVFKVRDFILTDLQQHRSIPALARRFKINPQRLKVFFKRQFGVGPYGFLLNARLDKVKELMERGMPMKEAAPLAGYSTTSFITAFRRRFGYSPGALFRKGKTG